MNLLDRAIGVVAHSVALQRVRSRVALELTTGYLERRAQRFRYDGATAGRRANGWYAASSDANVELMGSLIWLRNCSRDLVRNNPCAARGGGIGRQCRRGAQRDLTVAADQAASGGFPRYGKDRQFNRSSAIRGESFASWPSLVPL